MNPVKPAFGGSARLPPPAGMVVVELTSSGERENVEEERLEREVEAAQLVGTGVGVEPPPPPPGLYPPPPPPHPATTRPSARNVVAANGTI